MKLTYLLVTYLHINNLLLEPTVLTWRHEENFVVCMYLSCSHRNVQLICLEIEMLDSKLC